MAAEGEFNERDQFEDIHKCKIWSKLKAGEMYKITYDEVWELYGLLDPEKTGVVARDSLGIFKSIPELNLTDGDIEALANECDNDDSGTISCDELYKALTVGSVAMRQILQSFGAAKKLGQGECDREDLVEFIQDFYDKETALWSLPQTFVLFVSFVESVILHIDIGTAFKMQESLAGGVEGEGGPFLQKYVHDIPSMWDWMDTSFIGVHLKQDLANFPYPGRLESYNQIIGGIQLKKIDIPPAPCFQGEILSRVYDTLQGTCNHINNADENKIVEESKYVLYHESNDEIARMFQELRTNVWVGLNTSVLSHKALFYNAYLGAFTNYNLDFDFNFPLDAGKKDGILHMVFSLETWIADPYQNKLTVIPDFVFVFIVLRMFFGELQEVVPACMNGIDGFMDYWDFWNGVDWASMVLGMTYFIVWVAISFQVSGPLQDAVSLIPARELDREIIANHTYFTRQKLNDKLDAIGSSRQAFENSIGDLHMLSADLAGQHEQLRLLILCQSFVLLLKFFKAFKANPRLDVVIQTLQASFVDLVHFMFVFITIWMVFALTGYIRFGTYCSQFSSYWRAIMVSWRILMGEDIVEDMEEGSGSLGNFLIANLWVVLFQTVMAIILMNMTVAIIMDAYTAVNTGNQTEIWTQVRTSFRTARETKGFLNLWYLICEFKDDEEPAHPGRVITTKSLRRAFERDKMTKANAEWLIKNCQSWVEDRDAGGDLSLTDAIKVIGQVRTYVMKINDATQETLQMLKEERKAPQEARFDAIMRGDEEFIETAKNARPQSSANHSGQLALTNGSSNSTAAFGNTNNSGGSSALAVAPNTVVQETQLAPTGGGQTPAMQLQQRQMLQALAQNNMILSQLDSITQHVNRIDSRIGDDSKVVAGRFHSLEQRIWGLERRSERVEKACDQLRNTFQGVDFVELIRLPETLPKQVARQVGITVQSTQNAAAGVDANVSSGSRTTTTPGARMDHFHAIDEKLGSLVSLAEEQQEMRNMVWRIDLGVRALRSGHDEHRPGTTPHPGPRAAAGAVRRNDTRPGTGIASNYSGSKQTGFNSTLGSEGP
jgi:Ca2+-binding EF-hand superfamily protein